MGRVPGVASPSNVAESVMHRFAHLARRFLGSLSRRPVAAPDMDWVRTILTERELELWTRFGPADRRHTIGVARRFVERRPRAVRAEIAAALLHDIGKVDLDLGTIGRVVATIVGPRGERLRAYHDHERRGARLLEASGSDALTIALVAGDDSAPSDVLAALRDADDV